MSMVERVHNHITRGVREMNAVAVAARLIAWAVLISLTSTASAQQDPSTGSGQVPSTGSGQVPSTGSGQVPSTGSGQGYPNRPIRLIVPYAPGGSTSWTSRLVGDRLMSVWGQPVIIDNRPGASTVIGTEA